MWSLWFVGCSLVLSVSRITHERGNIRRPIMVWGVGRGQGIQVINFWFCSKSECRIKFSTLLNTAEPIRIILRYTVTH